jgi:hypothetical protein
MKRFSGKLPLTLSVRRSDKFGLLKKNIGQMKILELPGKFGVGLWVTLAWGGAWVAGLRAELITLIRFDGATSIGGLQGPGPDGLVLL